MAALRNEGPKQTWALMSPDGSYHKLREPSFFVGREQDVDLTLKSRSVDKKHAVIYTVSYDNGSHYIHDLESLNGTFVNEKRVQKSKLGLGDTVRFGYDMNIFRVDLYPCQDNIDTFIDENNNINNANSSLSSHKCYKDSNGVSGMPHYSENAASRLCHSCGSKGMDNNERPEPVLQGSTLYGQPSWWGWGSSDEEIYTYPNRATVVGQSGTLTMPSNCMVLQQRIKRNKANLEQHYASLKMPVTATTKDTKILQEIENDNQNHSLSTTNVKELYNLPSFGRWEHVPHGSYVQGLEDVSLGNDSYLSKDNHLSYHIPFVPDFGELPEKPVSEKSRRRSNAKSDTSSSTSSVSENSDLDYSPSRTPKSLHDRVFGLTELNDPLGSNSPKGVSVGKPKHLPVKIKPGESKPSTPRSVSEKSARVRRNSSASSVTKDSSTKGARTLTRVPSSGGSSVPSDNDLRDSGPTTITSTSDDSDTDNSPNKDEKRKTDKPKSKSESASPREVYTGDVTDKGQRPSSFPSSLPRVNKTALLRARNSREAIKSSARRPSPLRSRTTPKARVRRSTPSSTKTNHSSDSSPSSLLRIWSPSDKKTTRTPDNSPRSCSGDSSVSSSTTNCSTGDNDSAQAVVDAIFEAGPPGSYVLPKELQMDRNDSSNKTFVLEDKNNRVSSTVGTADTPDESSNSWDPSVDDNLETLQLSSCSEGDSPPLQYDRPVSRLPQPLIGDWMTSLTDRGRSVSPESLVSVPPASSPSPPSTPRTTAKQLLQERLNCCSAPPHSRRQWDITERPMEDLMLSSVHAFTVELRLASELVLSKARNLYEANSYARDAEKLPERGYSVSKDNQSKMPEWKSSHAEIAGVFRNLRRVEINLRTMDQALSFLCSTSGKDCRDGQKTSLPDRIEPSPRKWNDFKARARRFSWAEENRSKFPGPPSDDEEVTSQ